MDEILDIIRYEWLTGLEIVRRSEAQGGSVRRGTVYVWLEDLVDKGLVESRPGPVRPLFIYEIQLYEYRATEAGRRGRVPEGELGWAT